MLKQLFLSTALAAAFAATPALADDHEKMDKEEGVTKSFEDVERGDNKIVPDKKAYDKDNKTDKGNQQHPAHEMGEGDPEREQGQ